MERDVFKLHEASEWHDDLGDVLWWRIPIEEPPWVGSPLAGDWPDDDDYYTHWSFIPIPDEEQWKS